MHAALFSLLILATPALQAPDDYYPLAIGTQWTYKLGDKPDKFVIAASKTAKVGDQECVVLEAKFKDAVVGSEQVALLKDNVYRFMFGDKNFEPPIYFLKLSAKKGDSWKQEYKMGDKKGAVSFTVDVVDVEVPAGKFKDVLVVRVEGSETDMQAPDKPPTISKTTIYYAKNVGMVKQVIGDGEDSITLELEKMEGPKK